MMSLFTKLRADMQIPPIIELEQAAKKLVWAAKKDGTLKTLTPRLIRQTIEKQLGLEEASLDASEYKSAIKVATKSALDEDPASEEEEEEILKPLAKKVERKRKSDIEPEHEEDQPTPKSKRKSAATASKDGEEDEGSAKKKRKTVKQKKVESEHEKEENSDSEKASSTTTKKRKKKRVDTKQFKSLEHVPSSDMEQDEPGTISIAEPSIAKADSPKMKKESPLPKKAVPSKPSKETQNPESKPATDSQQPAPMVVGREVSSELSELEDPMPKKKAKATNKEPKTSKTKPTKGKEKEKKSAKSSTTLTKDEETIKRLKSFILACGVRKAWSKVFQDLDSPNQQIKKLKEILADLGMTGRMSMDQAKTIKRKRELAQELEDVQQFEKAVLDRSSRSRSQTNVKAAVNEDDSEKDKGTDSEEDEDEDSAPKRRPTNARKSIMAFLQDQSDEE